LKKSETRLCEDETGRKGLPRRVFNPIGAATNEQAGRPSRREVSCSEGERHEASSNEKSLKRAAMSRTVRNEEWGRDQEDNDGRNRERIDKVVDRIKSQFKREAVEKGPQCRER